jgi:mannose-1-phosphate guanylyltransferase
MLADGEDRNSFPPSEFVWTYFQQFGKTCCNPDGGLIRSAIYMTRYPVSLGGHWSVVSAGGEGAQMRAWITASLGISAPTQFCVLYGRRSMFQMTLDRARQIAPDGTIVAVTVRDFEQISKIQIGRRFVDLLVQPANRGTTGVIYFALSHIMRCDPSARVVIFPSDHFVEPEATFVKLIQGAMVLSALIPDKLVLIGATPDRMETDYGYVLPGDTIASYGGNRLSSVVGFREKPPAREISSIHEAGGLWNTFIIIGTVQAYLDAGTTCIPRILDAFYRYQPTIGGCQEKEAQVSLYQDISPSDFSKDVLQNVSPHLAMYQLNIVHWNDLGRPERIARSGVKLNDNKKLASASVIFALSKKNLFKQSNCNETKTFG